MWGVLPLSTFADSRTVRWTLGASDMMFNGMCVLGRLRNPEIAIC